MGGKAVAKSCRFRRRAPRTRALAVAALVAGGCASPLERDPILDRALARSIEREIASLSEDVGPQRTEQPPNRVEEPLGNRLEELEAMGPATATCHTPFELGSDLTGGEQQTVSVALDEVIERAIASNLLVQSARLQPAINAEDVIGAEAVFDFVLFASADFVKLDRPSPVPVIRGIPIGTRFDASETYRYSTGVRQTNTLGGQLTAAVDLDRFRNNSPGLRFSPDPAYTADLRLEYVQPLLRGFGTTVNRAAIRIAENAEASSVQQLRADLLGLVDDVESAYWELVFAWKDVEISQWLVDVGIKVRDDLEARLDFDTTPAEYTEAVARVEARKAAVLLARRAVRRASDRLKFLMNDPELPMGVEAVLRPIDAFLTAPVEYDLRESIVTALRNRPEIEQALLLIDDNMIGVRVADNLRLPQLDVAAQVAVWGIDDGAGGALENTLNDRFVDYILGVFFEYPIGNRGPEAEYRRARLARTQAYVRYRQQVENVVFEVKTALRDVVTNYELIGATRTTRVASAENLRTLLAEEPLRGMTPEFLDLKLNRQEALADARRGEFLALVEFDKALAMLNRAMGMGLAAHGIDFEQASAYTPLAGESALFDAEDR